MSWDADLYDDRGHTDGSWNYTHNCSKMANAVVDPETLREGTIRWWTKRNRQDVIAKYLETPGTWGSWWQCLDGMTGPDGAAFLHGIIEGLTVDPDRFRAMNPSNGWGDYDSFLAVLIEMRNAVPEWPTSWVTSG